jgi:hypothetical protein
MVRASPAKHETIAHTQASSNGAAGSAAAAWRALGAAGGGGGVATPHRDAWKALMMSPRMLRAQLGGAGSSSHRHQHYFGAGGGGTGAALPTRSQKQQQPVALAGAGAMADDAADMAGLLPAMTPAMLAGLPLGHNTPARVVYRPSLAASGLPPSLTGLPAAAASSSSSTRRPGKGSGGGGFLSFCFGGSHVDLPQISDEQALSGGPKGGDAAAAVTGSIEQVVQVPQVRQVLARGMQLALASAVGRSRSGVLQGQALAAGQGAVRRCGCVLASSTSCKTGTRARWDAGGKGGGLQLFRVETPGRVGFLTAPAVHLYLVLLDCRYASGGGSLPAKGNSGEIVQACSALRLRLRISCTASAASGMHIPCVDVTWGSHLFCAVPGCVFGWEYRLAEPSNPPYSYELTH